MKELIEEFGRIKEQHDIALRRRSAREATGPSVMRVFHKGTRAPMMDCLMRVDMDALKHLRTQKEFAGWFERNLDRLTRVIRKTNYGNKRIQPGFKWGHGTKVLALYTRSVVLNSRYFSDEAILRISEWLYIPVDGIVMDRLRELGIDLPFSRIKEIDNREKFHHIQDLLSTACKPHGIPRIWFDDVWADRM